MEFSRQEYWSGLPFSFPGDLPDPGIKPTSDELARGFFITEPPGGLKYLQEKVKNRNEYRNERTRISKDTHKNPQQTLAHLIKHKKNHTP